MRAARLLVSGSTALPAPVFARLTALNGHRPVQWYGMTQTLITLSARADGQRRPGHVGLPLAGVETRLLDQRGDPVRPRGRPWASCGSGGRCCSLATSTGRRPPPGRTRRTAGSVPAMPPPWTPLVGTGSQGGPRVDITNTGGYRACAGEVDDALLTHPLGARDTPRGSVWTDRHARSRISR
jgi:fatty acid CoA ligase FadD36